MNCPHCGKKTNVIDSRPSKGDVRRRRECPICGARFTTIESFESSPSMEKEKEMKVYIDLIQLLKQSTPLLKEIFMND